MKHKRIYIAVVLLIFISKRYLNTPKFKARKDAPLTIYVSDIPKRYALSTREKNRGGCGALGSFLFSNQWDSKWPRIVQWYIYQIKTSPMRTYDQHAADIIFVPFLLNRYESDHQNFLNDTEKFLPYLGKKPHIIVLRDPADRYKWGKYTFIKDPKSKQFTFLTIGYINKSVDFNLVGTPMLGNTHFSLESYRVKYDKGEVTKSKVVLAAQSFKVRTPERSALYRDCIIKEDKCKHINWTDPNKDVVDVYNNYASAWYSIQPKGDFIVRGALFDSWSAGSIPVVFHNKYFDSLPFIDFIDYKKLMIYIPEKQILNDGSCIDILQDRFDINNALKMTEEIYNIRHIFQYSVNPNHYIVRWNEINNIHKYDDAFTFTLKSVMRNICKSRGKCTNI